MATVLIAAVVAVLITALEALAEVVVVGALGYVITTIAVVRVLIGIRALVVRAPAVLAVCLSGKEALLVPIVHGLSKHVGAVLIGLVVLPAAPVAIVRSRVEVGITVVIVAIVPEIHLLLA